MILDIYKVNKYRGPGHPYATYQIVSKDQIEATSDYTDLGHLYISLVNSRFGEEREVASCKTAQ